MQETVAVKTVFMLRDICIWKTIKSIKGGGAKLYPDVPPKPILICFMNCLYKTNQPHNGPISQQSFLQEVEG